MPPDPARLESLQVIVSVLAVLGATGAATLRMLSPRVSRSATVRVASACAVLAVLSWLRFGALHVIEENRGGDGSRDPGARVQEHRPLQFHEFFHYYIGAKYFAELGYLGLYDCTALADAELAAQQGARPRIQERVRDLGDVLADKPVAAARSDCVAGARSRFSAERWASFEDDLRTLQRLVPDAWWNDVVDDKGLNPPPTFMALAAAVTQAIPIEAGGLPTYVFVTSIDLVLVAVSYFALRRMLGATASALAAVAFGASFLASYGWLGGAVLRFTWVAAIVLGLAALRRGRWLEAGLLLGWAGCDRVFPFAFVAGAAVPLAWGALRSPRSRAALARFAAGVGIVVGASVAASLVLFGAAPWGVFAARMSRDVHLHHVLMLGLDKVITFRSWVPAQDFNGHEGLARFRHWNERIDATWDSIRPLAIALQVGWMGLAAWVARARRPAEAAVLVGVTAMFVLASPVSYYWVVLALVPALLFRDAIQSRRRRKAVVAVFLAFEAWWLATLLLPRFVADGIVYDFVLCVGLAVVLAGWVAAWWGGESAGARGGRERIIAG
jgi:hypothetical protein